MNAATGIVRQRQRAPAVDGEGHASMGMKVEVYPAVMTERAAAYVHQRIAAARQRTSAGQIADVRRIETAHPCGSQLKADKTEHDGIERQPRNEPCSDPLFQGRHDLFSG